MYRYSSPSRVQAGNFASLSSCLMFVAFIQIPWPNLRSCPLSPTVLRRNLFLVIVLCASQGQHQSYQLHCDFHVLICSVKEQTRAGETLLKISTIIFISRTKSRSLEEPIEVGTFPVTELPTLDGHNEILQHDTHQACIISFDAPHNYIFKTKNKTKQTKTELHSAHIPNAHYYGSNSLVTWCAKKKKNRP